MNFFREQSMLLYTQFISLYPLKKIKSLFKVNFTYQSFYIAKFSKIISYLLLAYADLINKYINF